MTEAEVIHLLREHVEGQFPKVCPTCRRIYASLEDYLHHTERLGPIMSYDAELGNWNPVRQIGTMALSNCACGSTLALTSEGLPLDEFKGFLDWIRVETLRQGLSQGELLGRLRDEIRMQILAEEAANLERGVQH